MQREGAELEGDNDNEVLPKIIQYGRPLAQFFCILLGLIGIVLLSFSLEHDAKWNAWVESTFSLNVKNSNHHVRVDEYTSIDTQQDWIDLLKRDFIHDKLYLLFTIAVVLLFIFHTLSFSPSIGLGVGVYIFCGLLLFTSAVLLILSTELVDDDEGKIASLVEHLEKREQGTGTPRPIEHDDLYAAVEMGENVKHRVNCRTADQKHSAKVINNCQMYAVKVIAIIAAFLNTLSCAFLVWTFLWGICCGLKIKPDSEKEGQIGGNNDDTGQLKVDNQGHSHEYSTQTGPQPRTKIKKPSLITEEELRDIKDLFMRDIKHGPPNPKAYQPYYP